MQYIKRQVKDFLGYPTPQENMRRLEGLLKLSRKRFEYKIKLSKEKEFKLRRELQMIKQKLNDKNECIDKNCLINYIAPLAYEQKYQSILVHCNVRLMAMESKIHDNILGMITVETFSSLSSVMQDIYGSSIDLNNLLINMGRLELNNEMIQDILAPNLSEEMDTGIQDIAQSIIYEYELPVVDVSVLGNKYNNRDDGDGGGNPITNQTQTLNHAR